MQQRAFKASFAMLAMLSSASCTNGGTSFNPPLYVANVAATSKLQLAVGTATIAISPDAVSPQTFVGTNFVTTFRGVDGHSATTSNTPTLTGPAGFNFGPFLGGTNSISGRTLAQVQAELADLNAGTPILPIVYQGFGPLIGAFGYGLASDNLVSSQLTQAIAQNNNYNANGNGPDCLGIDITGGASYQGQVAPSFNSSTGTIFNPPTNVTRSAELALPILSSRTFNGGNCPDSADALHAGQFSTPGAPFLFPINYYGGPPTWPSVLGAGNPDYFLGYPVGFTDFAVPPVVGSYALSVAFPTAPDASSYGHVDAPAAQLSSIAPLGAIGLPTFVAGGDGSATVFVDVPPGVTETVVFARTPICDPAVTVGGSATNFQSANYSVLQRGSGRLSFYFGPTLGPPTAAGKPTHTFCSLSDFPGLGHGISLGQATISAVGFDYPAFEASYPANTSQLPTIANGTGQADITTSYPILVPLGMTPSMPASRKKR